ncbi:MAG TPA: hypothetical protein VE219_06380, partial [Candidatus Sulfotelmatobacter sp.]|nr:hypothetical protein [Candidatus Sulfotelmatobacter sp.]
MFHMPLWNIAPSAVAASAIDWDWQYVWSPLVFYVACVFVLFGAGRIPDVRSNRLTWPFQMISSSLTRLTGMPGWAAATVLSALLMLWMAVLGFYWDVAWHIDFGRDRQLFTPPHTMIVLGLGGLVYCAGVAITFATIEKAPVGFRVGPLHVPWSAPCLAAFGIGGVAAFPFDNLWHQTYGVDVTLWTPTHLQLLSGGVFSTIAVWLTIAEARGQSRPTLVGRLIHIVAAGAVLVGLSTFQGEFDFGASQFQMLYLPVLVAATAAFSLVAARLILGPGGAIKAVAAYLVLRTALSAIVGGSLQHTLPHFPLYLPSAVCVEVVALLLRTSHPLRFALAAGISVGTLGLALEWLWIDSWGLSFLSPVLIPKAAMLGPLAAAGAALLATGLATAFTGDSLRIPATVVAIGGLAVVAALAYPYPREVSDVAATVGVEASAD